MSSWRYVRESSSALWQRRRTPWRFFVVAGEARWLLEFGVDGGEELLVFFDLLLEVDAQFLKASERAFAGSE